MSKNRVVTGYFDSFDKEKLFFHAWIPEKQKKNIVFIALHGVAVHSTDFELVGLFFSDKGYSFYAFDCRGHGQCDEKNRGDLKDYKLNIKDIKSFVEFVKKKENPEKIILIGQSIGGTYALLTGVEYPRLVTAILVSSPGMKFLGSKFAVKIKKFTVFSIGLLLPKIKVPMGIKHPELVGDQKVLEKLLVDPLVFKKATARYVRELFKVQKVTSKLITQLKVPTFFIVAGADKIIDKEYTITLFTKIQNYPGMVLTVYKDNLHGNFNEVIKKREVVFNDMLNYLKL